MLCIDLQGTKPNLLIQGNSENNYAVINIAIVNYGDTPATVSLYAVPNGKQPPAYDSNGNLVSGNPETTLIKDKTIQAGDTLFLNLEKFLLHNGDALYAKKDTDANKVSVHVIYESY